MKAPIGWFAEEKAPCYCCIRSSRDRLGFYAKIHIIFVTVYRITLYKANVDTTNLRVTNIKNGPFSTCFSFDFCVDIIILQVFWL